MHIGGLRRGVAHILVVQAANSVQSLVQEGSFRNTRIGCDNAELLHKSPHHGALLKVHQEP